MSKIQNILLIAVGVITLGGAGVQGWVTDRWVNATTERLAEFTTRLDGVPRNFGQWVSVDTEVDAKQFKASNCHGNISRLYRNTVTNEEVNVFLVSGKGYHCTIHTPDYCYVAAGYETLRDPSAFEFEVPNLGQAEFQDAIFKKETATETTQLRILWSYSDDGKWTAPRVAKYSLGNKDALYKIYLISEIDNTAKVTEEDVTTRFAKEFFPIINNPLFAQAAPAPEAPPEG